METENILSEYLTKAELAAQLNRSVRSVDRWALTGDGPPCVRIGRRTLFRRAAVVEWLRALETTPGNNKLLTDPRNRPVWLQNPPDPTAVPQACRKNCPNSHSALKLFGRPLALSTDEVYGTFTDPSFGCRWGWMRTIDISDESHPAILGEYLIDEDQPAFCGSPGDDSLTGQFTSYSSHNPTVLRNLAVIAWHSGGLQIVDRLRPHQPRSFETGLSSTNLRLMFHKGE